MLKLSVRRSSDSRALCPHASDRQFGNYYKQGRDRLIQLVPAMLEFTKQNYSAPDVRALAIRTYLVGVSTPLMEPYQNMGNFTLRAYRHLDSLISCSANDPTRV